MLPVNLCIQVEDGSGLVGGRVGPGRVKPPAHHHGISRRHQPLVVLQKKMLTTIYLQDS